MRGINYSTFLTNGREEMVSRCIKVLNNNKKAIYILPSREAMFDVRERFMSLYGGIANTYVFGFDDFERLLCHEKLEPDKLLNSNLINAIIRNILSVYSEGTAYAAVKDKPGFIQALYGCIKKLKRQVISPNDLYSLAKGFNGRLLDKCVFVSEVYRQYEAYKDNIGCYDIDDVSLLSRSAIQDSAILKDTGIFVLDGFINIDPVNIMQLKGIMQHYPDISLLANIPYKNTNNEQFLMDEVIGDIMQLGASIDEWGLKELQEVNPAIRTIADSMYSGKKIIKEKTAGVHIQNSPCIEHEVRTTARIIKEKLIYGGTKPEDIAVYIKNIEEYEEAIHDIFEELGIPVHLTEEHKLMSLPVIKDICSLIGISLEDREREAFTVLCSSKYLLPNKILEYFSYETESLRKLAQKAGSMPKATAYKEELCRSISSDAKFEAIYGLYLQYLDRALSVKSTEYEKPEEYIRDIADILRSLDIRSNIVALYKNKLISGQEFALNLKAMELFEGILEEMAEISRLQPQTADNRWIEELYRELTGILSSTRTGMRASNLGGVKILEPDLARGQIYDCVFILGVNEGSFPGGLAANPLIDITEDDLLYKSGINLGNRLWELDREKLRFNMCIGTARKELYVSYRTSDEDGGYLIKSPFVDELEALFDIETLKAVKAPSVYMRDRFSYGQEPTSEAEGLRKLLNVLWQKRCNTDEQLVYVNKLLQKEQIIENLHRINNSAMVEFSRLENPLFDEYDGMLTEPQLAQGEGGYGFSASQINSYKACPFKYFSDRILGLSDLEEEEVLGARNVGSFYHEVLKQYYTDNKDWETYDEKRLRGIFEKEIAALKDESLPQILSNFISQEQWDVISAFVMEDAINLQYYHEASGFRMKPVLLEQPFSEAECFGGNTMRGIVDRVDLELRDDGSYTGRYIIYDYKKSGIKTLKDCIEGSDYQLQVYYTAVDGYLKEEFGIRQPECLAQIYYSIQNLERKGIIRRDAKPLLFEGKKGPRDLIGKGNMDILAEWVAENSVKLIEEIKDGHFNPPYRCQCYEMQWDCMYKTLCRYDRYRIASKQKAGERK